MINMFAHLQHALLNLFHPRRSNNHRPRILHPEALFFLAGIVVVFFVVIKSGPHLSNSVGSVMGYASNIQNEDVLTQVNNQRTRMGLETLTENELLMQAAQTKAQDMFRVQYWAHTSPSGTEPWDFITKSGYSYSVAGENLAKDFAITSDMVNAWMNSSSHQANILNPKYSETGIAVVNGQLDDVETTLVVQMFATPRTTQPNLAQAVQTSQQKEELLNPVATEPDTQVLAGVDAHPSNLLYSPLYIMKAGFLSLAILLTTILTYDLVIIGNKKSMRVVGNNFAHIMLMLSLILLILFAKGGTIG